MLKLLAILVFANAVASWESEVCCCGCESPCEITLKDSCGAPPTTPCVMKSNFNKEELLSPCSMVLKLHKYEVSGVKPIEIDYNAVTTAPAQNGDSSSHYRYGQVIPGNKTFESSQIKFSGSESHQYIPIPRKANKESLVSKTGEKTVIGLGYSSGGSYNSGSSGSYNPGPVSSYNAGSSGSYNPSPVSSYNSGSSGSYNPGPVSSYNSGSSSSYNSGSGMSHNFERKRRQVENSHSQSVFPFSLPTINLDKIFSSSSTSGGEVISDKHVVEGGIPMREIIRRLPDGGISVMKFNDDGTNKSVTQLESESRANASKFTSELQQQISQAMSQVKDTFDKMFSGANFFAL